MAIESKWKKMLMKNDGYVDYSDKKSEEILKSPSPSFNYLFGKKQGISSSYSLLLYGPPKSGKTLLSMALAGALHKQDPEAIVLHFDTEMRKTVDTWADVFGIDKDRVFSYATNDPVKIFDFIATDVAAMLQDGAPIKMIIIDSLEGISYPKESNADSSVNHVIGDASAYLKRAMKLILPVIRKHQLYNIFVQHVRSNMDPASSKYKPYVIPGGSALKFFTEYWILCQKIDSKDSKVFDSKLVDGSSNQIQTGHSIRVKMEENSLGPQNRSAAVHLSYTEGLVNQHIEITEIAIGMGIVSRPNNLSYEFGGKKWTGRANFDMAVKEDKDLQTALLNAISEADLT